MTEVIDVDFDRKKTAYCAKFAVLHTSVFRPHYKEGQTLGKGPDVWRNVSEHCLVAGIFADILAEGLNLPPDQRKRAVDATLLHDWYKKHEQMAQKAATDSGTLSLQTFDEIRDKDYQRLRELGVDEATVQLTGSDVPEDASGPQDFERKIVWYVDAMLSGTEPVRIGQRFDDLKRGWDGATENPERAKRNMDFSDAYKQKYDSKSLYDVQIELGDRIGSEFSRAMGFTGDPVDFPLY